MNQSLTISGAAVVVLSMIFSPEEASALVAAAVGVVKAAGILMIYWGRYRQGDINWYGKKV